MAPIKKGLSRRGCVPTHPRLYAAEAPGGRPPAQEGGSSSLHAAASAAPSGSSARPRQPPVFFFVCVFFFFCGVCFCLRSLSDLREKWPPGSPWNWVARFRKRWRNGEKEQAQARRAVPVSGGAEQARGAQKRMGTQRGCGQKACQSPRGPWRVWSRQWEEGAARLQAWRRGGAMQHAVGGRAPGGHLAGRGGAAGGQVKALAAHVARRESGSAEGLRGKEGEDAGAQEVSGSGKGNAAQPAPSSRSSCWSARSKGQRRARRGRPPLRPRRRQGPRPRPEEGCARAQPRRRGEAKRRQTRRRRPRLSHRRPLPQRGSGAPVPWGCPDGREPRGTRLSLEPWVFPDIRIPGARIRSIHTIHM